MSRPDQDTQPDTARPRRILLWLAGTLAVFAAMVTAAVIINPPPTTVVTVPARKPDKVDIRGFVTLTPGSDGSGVLTSTSQRLATGHARCWGQNKFRDIGHGSPVTVYDDQDTIIAMGYLGPGRTADVGPVDREAASCLFPIVITGVLAESAFYQVEIAGQGTVTIENTPDNGALFAFLTLSAETPTGTS